MHIKSIFRKTGSIFCFMALLVASNGMADTVQPLYAPLNDIPGTTLIMTNTVDYVTNAIAGGGGTGADVGLVATNAAKYFAGIAATDATNYTDSAVHDFAATGTVFRAEAITDGTNTIDAAGNVYVKPNGWSFALHATGIASDATSEEIRSKMSMGTPIWGYGLVESATDQVEGWFIYRSQAQGFYRGDSPDSSVELQSYEYLGAQGGPLDTVIEYNSEYDWDGDGDLVSVSGTIRYGMTTVVGKLALTNDIPNYAAVSNAAMNARSVTDLGVRGAPLSPNEWFVVNGSVFTWDSVYWGSQESEYVIEPDPPGYSITDQSFFSENFSLDENFEFHTTNGDVPLHIVGYTNTLAQVSQIPVVPQGIVFTNSQGAIQANLRITGSLMQGCSTITNVGFCAHEEGTNTTAIGMHSHAEGYGTRTTGYGEYGHAEGLNTSVEGTASHAEGGGTTAKNTYSHAEGYHTLTDGKYAHAEGYYTKATGMASKSGGGTGWASNDFAYVWSGQTNNINQQATWYGSHGVGTFNVNPVGGLDGFWVGNNKLGSLMGFGMVTPSQTGDWQFSGSGVQSGHEYTIVESEEEGFWSYDLNEDGEKIDSYDNAPSRQVTITFSTVNITATRAYPLQNRSINSLVCQAATTNFLQFPPAIDNMARDFYVRLTLETNSSSVGVAKFDTSVTYETADGNWPDFSTGGTYIVRLTETGRGSEWTTSGGVSPYTVVWDDDHSRWSLIDNTETEVAYANGTQSDLQVQFVYEVEGSPVTVTATRKPVFLLTTQPAKQATQS